MGSMKTGLPVLFLLLVPASLAAQTDADHHSGVVQRGEDHAGMGFSQTATTHHFLLTENGGIIQVTAKDPKDGAQIEMIQMHLQHIAGMFAEGNFSIPHFVHAQTPPGVETMQRLKGLIRYSAEAQPAGGRVRIETDSAEARAAIHEFLRFQIKDHETGDPLTIR